VFLPCAGLGERLGKLTNNVNKALVSLGHKPLISRIIEKFDPKIKFVIALGYKGDILREFLDLTYPKLDITYVEVSVFQGEKSSLGRTILECEQNLQEPFIFWACDSIVYDEIITINQNWIGVSNKKKSVTDYRSVKPNENVLTKIFEKGFSSNKNPYIGIAGIYSYKEFWEILKNANFKNLKKGEVFPINEIAKSKNVIVKKFKWIDAGNKKELDKNQKNFSSKDLNILPKTGENIWFANNLVTKFSIDKQFIKRRVNRAEKIYRKSFTLLFS